MTERILDIAEVPARLSVRHEQLVIAHDDQETTTPLEEVAALIVSNPGVTYTQAVIVKLMEAGGVFIVCDGRHLPAGMMLPLEGHHVQTARLRQQIEASEPTRKQAWKQLVQAKVEAQGRLLERVHGQDHGLVAMAGRVRSGDADNVEAQAARKYFPALFGQEFQRNRDMTGTNALLNYGYTVLRAIIARALVGAGLHPSIGLHHHNRYDPYCLAADVMEPFRVLVDEAVLEYLRQNKDAVELNPSAKRHLITALMRRYAIEDEDRSLFDIAARTAVSLVRVFEGTGRSLALPDFPWGGDSYHEAAKAQEDEERQSSV
jgi:CRISPR-associated protein Cas1